MVLWAKITGHPGYFQPSIDSMGTGNVRTLS